MKKFFLGIVSAALAAVLFAGAVACAEGTGDLSGEATAYGLCTAITSALPPSRPILSAR